MILSIFKMNIIGTYAYFQFEVLYLYPVYIDFPASLCQFSMSVPLVGPQFGMASLCQSAHSLQPFLRHSSLNLRWFYLVVLRMGKPPSIPLEEAPYKCL